MRVLVCLAIGWASPVLAQDDGEVVTIRQLQEELAERDAIIIDLINRIESLEEMQGGTSSAGGSDGVDARVIGADSAVQPQLDAPAEIDIEVLRAERALERGLVERGARLLAPGQIELSPSLNFYHDESMFPAALMSGALTTVGEVERTIDLYEGRAEARFGLPADLQLEIGLPYLSADQQIVTSTDGSVRSVLETSGSGNGDATLGLARAFGDDRAGGASVIGRLSWLSGSGDERDGSVFLGAGNSGLSAQATAFWRRDPVVFLLTGGYTHFQERNSLQRGDSVLLSLGLGLAISPEAAMIFALNQTRTSEFERLGVTLPGTDQLASSLRISAQTVFGQRFSLGVDADVGLTDDATDYRFGLSLSSRFGVR